MTPRAHSARRARAEALFYSLAGASLGLFTVSYFTSFMLLEERVLENPKPYDPPRLDVFLYFTYNPREHFELTFYKVPRRV